MFHVLVLVDGELELTRILNLVRSKEGINVEATVRLLTETVFVVTAVEDEVSFVLVPLPVVRSIDRDYIVRTFRLEETLSLDRVVLEFKVLGVSQFDVADLHHGDGDSNEKGPSGAIADL